MESLEEAKDQCYPVTIETPFPTHTHTNLPYRKPPKDFVVSLWCKPLCIDLQDMYQIVPHQMEIAFHGSQVILNSLHNVYSRHAFLTSSIFQYVIVFKPRTKMETKRYFFSRCDVTYWKAFLEEARSAVNHPPGSQATRYYRTNPPSIVLNLPWNERNKCWLICLLLPASRFLMFGTLSASCCLFVLFVGLYQLLLIWERECEAADREALICNDCWLVAIDDMATMILTMLT